VSTGYTIKDAAERSGFTAATLRYYEEIGLVGEPARTPAGYRLYDDQALEQLAFISRAKQLGCSLDEIAELTVAREGGHCGPVQDRLRAVVADKIATAQEQIIELMTLTSDLRRAAATLSDHRPDGPCDDRCGCVTDPTSAIEAATPQPVRFGRAPDGATEAPIVCTLGSRSARGRLDEWQQVLEHAERREPIDGGVRLTFGSMAAHAELLRLVVAEQACCQFFAFALTVDGRGVALEVRAPDDGHGVLHSLFGGAA